MYLLLRLVLACSLTMQLEQLPCPGNPIGYKNTGYPPQRRSGSSIVVSDTYVYIYGGFPLRFSDIWIYDRGSNIWRNQDTTFSKFK